MMFISIDMFDLLYFQLNHLKLTNKDRNPQDSRNPTFSQRLPRRQAYGWWTTCARPVTTGRCAWTYACRNAYMCTIDRICTYVPDIPCEHIPCIHIPYMYGNERGDLQICRYHLRECLDVDALPSEISLRSLGCVSQMCSGWWYTPL